MASSLANDCRAARAAYNAAFLAVRRDRNGAALKTYHDALKAVALAEDRMLRRPVPPRNSARMAAMAVRE